ncbi:MAG: FtsW/RodA/SpoVE family cell cycle protein [Lentisphaeria bacterium]|nr:FtsW/RodA/SpoVE family cell cycle protein [Lentisphaeria bacterium]
MKMPPKLKDVFRRNQDWLLLCVVLALVFLGIMAIRETDFVGMAFDVHRKWVWQARWAAIGGTLLLLARSVDHRSLGTTIFALYGLSIVLLLFVLVFGAPINGARRWITLFGVLSFQPGSFALFVVPATFCYWMSNCPFTLSKKLHLRLGVVLVLVPAFLIFIEPAGGTSLALVVTVIVIDLVCRAPASVVKRILLFVGGGFVLAQAVLVWVRSRNIDPVLIRETYELWPYKHQTNRIVWFLTDVGSWNGQQSVLCFVSGGLVGKGSGQGFLQSLGYLPRGVASNDFLFSVVGETTGFTGCVVILLLYGVLIASGFAIAVRAKDTFGRMLACGITTLFALHIVVNLLMVVRMLPVVGLPLPFFSQGGTFLVMSMLAMGVLASVHRESVKAELSVADESVPQSVLPVGVHQTVLSLGPLLQLFFQYKQSKLTECAQALEELAAAHADGFLFALGPPDPLQKKKKGAKRRRSQKKNTDELQEEFPNFSAL